MKEDNYIDRDRDREIKIEIDKEIKLENHKEKFFNKKIKRRILSLKKLYNIKNKKIKILYSNEIQSQNQSEAEKINKKNNKKIRKIFFKRKKNEKILTLKSQFNNNNKLKDNNKIKIGKFHIQKSNFEFDEKVNYYIEYWKMFNENEYILAKIKENLYEINNMRGHLEELKKLEYK